MFEQLLARSNDAINDNMNQSAADIEITTAGSSFLWMVFCVMAFTGLAIFIHANTLPKGDRVFHYLSVAILFTASVAYYSLAADLGAVPITVEFLHGFNLDRTNGRLPTRQIWYVRYIDWTVTTPLLLLELLLVSGLPLSQVFMTLFLDEVMIIGGLIGALTISQYKWGYFAFANAAMFMVFWTLYIPGLKSAGLLGKEFKKAYIISTGILSILWLLYPVAWGLADGSNQISPDGVSVNHV
jgi:bacteriorhodopsin